MSRPKPLLAGTVFSHNDSVLTPRTPRSRAGRTEEARFEFDGDEGDEGFYELDAIQQRAPLLSSSASASFPHRRHTGGTGKTANKAETINVAWPLKRIPLVAGLATAIALAFLIILSVETPEALHTYLHGSASPPNDQANATSSPMSKLVYEGYDSFPLTSLEYRQECAKFQAGMTGPMGTYWHIPPGGPMDVVHSADSKICKSSITYMLDGYVGLAADLALMAQAAGLARETNRTFFVDDQNWNRGRWTDHFQDVRGLQPGPEPGCLPPPPEELVACPRTARHWVVSSRTALFHFGHHFMDEYEDPYARELRRLKPIFERAVTSFEHAIRPNAESAALIQAARREIGQEYVAVHIRRGDRHTEAWRYHGGYVPIEEYANAVGGMWMKVTKDRDEQRERKVWIASDDLSASDELAELLFATGFSDMDADAVQVHSLDRSSDPKLNTLESDSAYVQAAFDALPVEERIRLTRGAVVDLALISGLWSWSGDAVNDGEPSLEGVVCTISSNFCKLAAVGLGWDSAFGFESGDPDKTIMVMDDERARWAEIDTRGEIDPVWRPLELF